MYVSNFFFPVPLSILCFSLSVMKELVVSAGDSVEVTLPKNEVQLNAFVLPEPPPRKASLGIPLRAYDGEMANRHYVQHYIRTLLKTSFVREHFPVEIFHPLLPRAASHRK